MVFGGHLHRNGKTGDLGERNKSYPYGEKTGPDKTAKPHIVSSGSFYDYNCSIPSFIAPILIKIGYK